ncbi:hypothetical protein I4U23_014517 [Adineta vaga]|nr:hypothetical protein I4U23_014517 [Adineta vaga]
MRQLFTISGRYATTEDISVSPQTSGLSWNTRLKGFGICLLVGSVLGIVAVIVYFAGGNLSGFAILYSFAVIFSLGSTFFLMGPMNQLKKMFDSSRFIATIIFLICVVMTLVSAIAIKISILVLLFVILQMLALLWYTLSYIPYARDAIKTCCRGLIR